MLVDAIGGHSGYMVVVQNSGRNVNLWRPLNYTLPRHDISDRTLHWKKHLDSWSHRDSSVSSLARISDIMYLL